MGRNHLPGNLDLKTFGRPLYAETPFVGVGFGLGFAVTIDPVAGEVISSEGELTWGGAASTMFWIDPSEELTVSFFTQLLPSSSFPIRSQLRQLVYQALVTKAGPGGLKAHSSPRWRSRSRNSSSASSRSVPSSSRTTMSVRSSTLRRTRRWLRVPPGGNRAQSLCGRARRPRTFRTAPGRSRAAHGRRS